ncbi:hypothetical protein OG599_34615 (plasmid) [Streptomyces sp. NBC_01335]|uniref:hypothetical protein n=1 Tax=Streptomyces sp. NBC_01335 TaxID=2903828 RepID=UPI002E0D5E52|nr:hypothetical protein OG599_34615 [Streptomyces sp. NBC_01335]
MNENRTRGDLLMPRFGKAILAFVAAIAFCALPAATAHAEDATTQAACPTQPTTYYVSDFGYVQWAQNPICGTPGDAMRVCDTKADGMGLLVQRYKLSGGVRYYLDTVSTAGHNSPYCSPWLSNNLPEGTAVLLVPSTSKGGVVTITPYSYNVTT